MQLSFSFVFEFVFAFDRIRYCQAGDDVLKKDSIKENDTNFGERPPKIWFN